MKDCMHGNGVWQGLKYPCFARSAGMHRVLVGIMRASVVSVRGIVVKNV